MLAPSLFNTCMAWVLSTDLSHCRASVANTEITEFVSAYDAVTFAESLEALAMALQTLHY